MMTKQEARDLIPMLHAFRDADGKFMIDYTLPCGAT